MNMSSFPKTIQARLYALAKTSCDATRAAFAGAAVLVVTFANPAYAQKAPIVIGQSIAMSGPSQQLGIAYRDGALLYFDFVNKQGGINGRAIELAVLDDEGSPAKTAANTKKLITENNVTALFGYVGSSSIDAAVPIASAQKVALVGPASGSPALRASLNRYVFNVRASYADEVELAIEQTTKQGLTRFAVLYQDDSFGKAVLAHVTESLARRKLTVDLALPVPPNTVATGTQSKAMAAKDLQGIIIAVPYAAAGSFIKDMKAANRAAMFINVSSVGTQELRDTLRDQGRGVQMLNIVPSPWDGNTPVIREYQQRMNDIGRSDRFYSFASVEGFIAAKALVSGLRKAGKNVDRETLIAGMEQVNENFGGYVVSFSPTNHNGSKYVEMTIINKDGRFFK